MGGIIDEDNASAKAYDRRLTLRLLGYLRPYSGMVALALLLLCVEGALQLLAPALTRHVIDVALPARDMGEVRLAAALFVGSLLVQFACSYGETLITSRLGQRVMYDMRMQIFAHLQRLPIPYFSRNPVGRLITRVTSDVEALNEMLTAGVVAGLGDLFTLATIGVAMLLVDWRLALAAFLVIPFVVLVSQAFRSNVRREYAEIRIRLARINAFLQERLSGMRIVQLFGRESDEMQNFARLNRDHLDSHLRSVKIYALYFPAIEILSAVALASLIVAGHAGASAGTLSVGTIAAFLMLVRRFFQPLQDLSEKFNILQSAMAASERIFSLLDVPAGVSPLEAWHPDGRSGLGGSAGAVLPRASVASAGVTVEFRNVWFSYDDNGTWVLQDVSFTARSGQTLAIVGHTGAGKTTLINLLLRFYEPQRGTILLDGRDITTIPVAVVRGAIGYVQQDIFLFAGDVESNIRLSSELSRGDVERIARSVGADELIRRLPRGYSEELGERGARLSVGERQLLALARALAAQPRLLLLDEATSSVDSELEARISGAVSLLMRERTTIAIAHRLSTIAAAHTILVMHHGRIVERGSHAGLLRARGLYERLYRLQLASEHDEVALQSNALETTDEAG